MADLKELIERLSKAEQALKEAMPNIVAVYAGDTAALSVQKLHTKGIEGRNYSTKPMLATKDQFNRKAAFKPTEIATTLGRDEEGNLVKGGTRTKKGNVKRGGTEKRYRWVKFPHASKAVPVMELEQGYKQLRELNGLQTAFVDETFSGRMLQNVKVVRQDSDGNKFTAYIGATESLEKKKLAGQRARMGDFLNNLTEEERRPVNEAAFDKMKNIIIQTLGLQ